jgi:hypothetical protein
MSLPADVGLSINQAKVIRSTSRQLRPKPLQEITRRANWDGASLNQPSVLDEVLAICTMV